MDRKTDPDKIKSWILIQPCTMKKIWIIVIPIILGYSQVQYAQPTDSLAAWYPFNGNANDETGHGFNGIIYRVAPAPDRCNEPDKAMNFSKTNNYIVLSNTGSLHLSEGPFSVVFWFRRADYPNLVFGGPVFSNPGFKIEMLINGQVIFTVNSTVSSKYMQFMLFDYQWHMVSAVADQQKLLIYIDKIPEDSSGYTLPPANSEDITIGGSPSSGFYHGLLDDVRIYTRSLSYSEILELYDEKPFASHISVYLENWNYCLDDPIKIHAYGYGSPGMNLQWQNKGENIAGANGPVLFIPRAQPSDTGGFRCIASNGILADTSDNLVVNIEFARPTEILGYSTVREYQVVSYYFEETWGHNYQFTIEGGNLISRDYGSITVHWGARGIGTIRLVETSEIECTPDTVRFDVTIGNLGLGDASYPRIPVKVYPNPFNVATTITYDNASPCRVKLQVFDSFGRLVAEPVNASRQKGEQNVTWDAEGLPSGVYYYRLNAGNKTATGKLFKSEN